jgi:hypothetical protein
LLPLTQTNLGDREDRCSPLLQSIQQASARSKAK